MAIKTFILFCLRTVLFRNETRVVVASTGRAGSTMLFSAIAKGYVQHRFGIKGNGCLYKFLLRLTVDYLDRLSNISSNSAVILKTHALWRDWREFRVKYIFIHGDPLESALSVERMVNKLGEDWFIGHLDHLESEGSLPELYKRDVLNYRDQIQSWSEAPADSVLCLAYERLWDSVDAISRHVGFDVSLPLRIEREEKQLPDDIDLKLFADLRVARGRAFPEVKPL